MANIKAPLRMVRVWVVNNSRPHWEWCEFGQVFNDQGRKTRKRCCVKRKPKKRKALKKLKITFLITPPFSSTLALFAIPWPMALGLQTGAHNRENRSV